MAEKVLESCFIQLRDGLTKPVIKSLSDELRRENVLGMEEIEEILHETKTRTDQARFLIDYVEKKGRKASEILLKCLKEKDELFYKELKIESYSDTPETGETSSHPPSSATDKASTTNEYKMDSNPRGLCVIINNENFTDHAKKREGSQKDVDSLKNLFEDLGFLVEIKKDKTTSDLERLMIQYREDPRHGDCFVCCVMSHGNKTGVLGFDMTTCPLENITSPFDAVNCPLLIGKPKVFFIQACRGHEMQSRVLVVDGPGASRMQKPGKVYSIPKDSDFLIALSTVEGYFSIRDPYSGSWFIQSLCEHLKEGSKGGQSILDILTEVNNDVSLKDGTVTINNDEIDAKMTPEKRSTLRKRLVFKALKGQAAASKQKTSR